jgi:hypothetical protein
LSLHQVSIEELDCSSLLASDAWEAMEQLHFSHKSVSEVDGAVAAAALTLEEDLMIGAMKEKALFLPVEVTTIRGNTMSVPLLAPRRAVAHPGSFTTTMCNNVSVPLLAPRPAVPERVNVKRDLMSALNKDQDLLVEVAVTSNKKVNNKRRRADGAAKSKFQASPEQPIMTNNSRGDSTLQAPPSSRGNKKKLGENVLGKTTRRSTAKANNHAGKKHLMDSLGSTTEATNRHSGDSNKSLQDLVLSSPKQVVVMIQGRLNAMEQRMLILESKNRRLKHRLALLGESEGGSQDNQEASVLEDF